MSASGRETLLDEREWSGSPPRCPGMVRRPSHMSWNGRETLLNVQEFLLDVREWSGDTSGCPGVVRRPYRMSG